MLIIDVRVNIYKILSASIICLFKMLGGFEIRLRFVVGMWSCPPLLNFQVRHDLIYALNSQNIGSCCILCSIGN